MLYDICDISSDIALQVTLYAFVFETIKYIQVYDCKVNPYVCQGHTLLLKRGDVMYVSGFPISVIGSIHC